MARRTLIATWALLGVACTEAPKPHLAVQLDRLGDPLGPTLDAAVAAAVHFDGQRDTVCLWESPWSEWSREHALRAGDGGRALIGEEWHPFEILQLWTESDWSGPVRRSVERGAFSDSLWLAAVHGGRQSRLSPGSGCWVLQVDSQRATPAVDGDVLTIAWSQRSAFEPASSETRAFEMAFRWGDEDQVLPGFLARHGPLGRPIHLGSGVPEQ